MTRGRVSFVYAAGPGQVAFPERTAQKTSLPLLRVFSLPGKRFHRAVP
jgi:hypothetical protein